MAKFKVISKFRDKYTGDLYEAGKEIEITLKRAAEIKENLSEYGKVFLERIENNK